MTGIVDSHVHLWDPEVLDYAWLEGGLARRHGPAELSAAAGGDGIRRIFVEADCAPAQSLDEVDGVVGLAEAASIVGIVAHAAVESDEVLPPQLDALRERPLVVGVRRLLQSEPAGFATSPAFLRGARRLAEAGLVFDACVTAPGLGDVTALADAVPELSIVLDHLGKPQVGAPGRPLDSTGSPWAHDLTRLAARPGVSCKLSGLPAQSPDGWVPRQLTPFLDTALEAFGPDRLLFGSDWPVSGPLRGWQEFVAAWALDRVGADHAMAIMGANACRVYGVG